MAAGRIARVWRGGALAAAACGVLAGCAAAPTQSCRLYLATSLPIRFTADNSEMGVPVTLGSVGLGMVVDTGGTGTLLADTIVKGVVRTEGEDTIGGVGGGRFVSEAVLPRFDLGRLHGQIGALTTTFDPQYAKDGFAGLLGMDILGGYDIDLDLAGGALRLFKSEGTCTTITTFLPPPLYGVAELPASPDDARPVVPVGIGGQQFAAMLDTGSPGVTLSARAALRLGLDAAALSGDKVVDAIGVGSRHVAGRRHLLSELTLGDLTIHNVPAVVLVENFDPQTDVLLGLDIMRRIHFWLSNSTHQVVMQYPALASPELPPDL